MGVEVKVKVRGQDIWMLPLFLLEVLRGRDLIMGIFESLPGGGVGVGISVGADLVGF